MFLRLPPVSSLFNFVPPLLAWNAYHTAPNLPESGLGGVRLVPVSQLASYKPLGEFARAAYCLNGLQTWTCGCELISLLYRLLIHQSKYSRVRCKP